MRIIMDLTIICKKSTGGHVHSMLRKEFDSSLIPAPGMYFEDQAWREPNECSFVTCNFDEEYYHLQFPAVEIEGEEYCKREEEMYRLHGWKGPDE